MITYKTASTQKELRQILVLQQANLPQAVSPLEKKAEGFVTVHHDPDILKQMNDACPHIIAKDREKVIGYALCMHPKFETKIDILKPMFSEIKKCFYTKYIVMGQICIDKAYRKQGVFRKLYETMKETVGPEFSTIITEVDASNARSLNAHYAIGFKSLSNYKADGRNWELIYLS